jgi:hypothetical protein
VIRIRTISNRTDPLLSEEFKKYRRKKRVFLTGPSRLDYPDPNNQQFVPKLEFKKKNNKKKGFL